MQIETKKYSYIDAVRGIAILMVVFCHVNNLVPTSGFFWSFMGQGARGVQLFYIASALTLLLSFGFRASQGEKHLTLNFFIRRFFRIAPLFYCALCFYVLTYPYVDRSIVESVPHIFIWNILSAIFFFNGVSPYWINSLVPGGWSISIEFFFYLFIPVLFFAYTKQPKEKRLRFLYTVFLFVFSIGLIIKYLLLQYPLIDITTPHGYNLWDAYLFYFFPSQACVFIIGCIVYHKIVSRPQGDGVEVVNKKEVYFIILCLLLSFLFRKFAGVNLLPSFIFYSFVLGYGVVLLEKYKDTSNLFYRLCVNRGTRFFGTISYSLYLVHFAVIFAFLKYDITAGVRSLPVAVEIKFFISYILLLFVSSLISYMTYICIEKPGILLGNKIIRALQNK